MADTAARIIPSARAQRGREDFYDQSVDRLRTGRHRLASIEGEQKSAMWASLRGSTHASTPSAVSDLIASRRGRVGPSPLGRRAGRVVGAADRGRCETERRRIVGHRHPLRVVRDGAKAAKFLHMQVLFAVCSAVVRSAPFPVRSTSEATSSRGVTRICLEG